MEVFDVGGGSEKAKKITLLCIIGNIILCLFKGFAGHFGGSKAMLADAYHSLSDVVATLVVYISLKIADRPVDADHHYGHGKVEPLAAAFVGITLIAASGLILRDILISISSGIPLVPLPIALIAAGVSIFVKEIMFRITYAAGKKIGSDAVVANAWDHRSDAYSSMGAFAGIAGSMAGNVFDVSLLKYLDPMAGIIVVFLIAKIAVSVMKKSVNRLMDTSPEEEVMDNFKEILLEIEGIEGVTWIKARYMGRDVMVDLAIEVDALKTIEQGHYIASDAKKALMDNYDNIGDVIIHINPCRIIP
ncbi:MAG TPA: cation transporter [Firmicutes bacterium]|nr:cation transporter [Bacillota bacterium]